METEGGAVENWREARRSRILAAAVELFASRGFVQVQMDDVARLAGMGKPTLYRYFPSKAELFLAAFDSLLDGLDTKLQDISTAPLPPRQQIAEMVHALVMGLADQIATLRYLEGESPALAGRWRLAYRRRRETILSHLRKVVEAGIAASDFEEVDLEVVPALIMGMVRGGLVGSTASALRTAAAAQELVLGGLLKRPQ